MPELTQLSGHERWISLSNRMRNKRFQAFEAVTKPLPRPLRIVDIGGTSAFWQARGWNERNDVHITTVNLATEPQRFANIESVVGDATDLSMFADRSFDIAFSNSVIEHLFTYENQLAMAREVQRLARAFYVQTPNFWFPFEPHFRVPGWQWMPRTLRIKILRKRRCGFRGPAADVSQAQSLVDEVRLLSRRELKELFPDSSLLPERFCGLVKSWIVIHGFPR